MCDWILALNQQAQTPRRRRVGFAQAGTIARLARHLGKLVCGQLGVLLCVVKGFATFRRYQYPRRHRLPTGTVQRPWQHILLELVRIFGCGSPSCFAREAEVCAYLRVYFSPAGYFGGDYGISSPNCTWLCQPGSYCPPGTSSFLMVRS